MDAMLCASEFKPIKVTENADKKQEESSNTKCIQQCTLYILM